MQAIEVHNISVDYRRAFKPSLRAVNEVSFSVGRGEIVGFLGVNGAGKSSTIKALMGFQPLSSGSAAIFGEQICSVESRRRVGFLPETATYSPYLTPMETMQLYATLQGVAASDQNLVSETVLGRVGMFEKRNTLNKSLSKGMLQRVGIAQSLIGEPELLILDEVSSGLDPIGRRDLRTLLRTERDRGATVFFSSHNLGEVELLCDRILIIHQGKLIDEQHVGSLLSSVSSLEDYFVETVELGHGALESKKVAA